MTADELRTALRCGRPRCPCRRPRGPVHCPAHGCPQGAVLRALRGRDLWPPGRTAAPGPRTMAARALALAAWAPGWRPGVWERFVVADAARAADDVVASVRRETCEGDPDVWDDLAQAAHLERLAEGLWWEAWGESA